MPRRPLCLSLALLLTACVVGDPEPEPSALEAPTFDAETDAGEDEPAPAVDETDEEPTDADTATAESEPDEPDSGDDTRAEPEEPGSPDEPAEPRDPDPDTDTADEPEPVLRSLVADPRGDTQSTRLTSGPVHADLVGGLLERHPQEGYRLAIELDGGAPEHARDGDHTMNIATFYDLTGDGHVDVEVWANLADGGWDTAFFDNRAGEAAYSDDDEIEVALVDDAVVLTFPLDTLEGAGRFRWAVASEWGRYEQLGTPLSVRDEMPDDGRPAPFPG